MKPDQLTLAALQEKASHALTFTQQAARDMYHGEHLGGTSASGQFAYWRGPVFTLDDNGTRNEDAAQNAQAAAFVKDFQNALKRSFTSTNLIREVLDREVGVSLSRMTWETDPQTDKLLRAWWKTRNTHPERVIREVITTARREGRGALRFRFTEPPTGTPSTPEALARFLRLEAIPPESVKVVEGEDGQSYAMYTYRVEGQDAGEVCYLTEQGKTVMRVFQHGKTQDSDALALGGRLTIIEVELPPLVTPQVLQNQMGYNTVATLALRNTELAGFVERYGVGITPPYVLEPDPNHPGQMQRRYLPVKVGGGRMNFWARETYDKVDAQGRYLGEEPTGGSPQYGRLEPVSADPLMAAATMFRTNLYGEVGQAFVLMSSDATASGRSREVSMSDFDARREVVTDAGRYLIGLVCETAAALLYALAGQPRPDVQVRGMLRGRVLPQSEGERAADLADMEKGVLTLNEVRARRGVDEVALDVPKETEEGEHAPPQSA